MSIDSFILWLEPANNLANIENSNSDNNLENEELEFSERLLKGNLGNIDKGAGSNE